MRIRYEGKKQYELPTHLDECVLRLIEILETTEISNNGHRFYPTTINSCRIMRSIELGELLPRMKELAYRDQQEREMEEWNI